MTKKNSNIYRITDPLMEPYFIQYDQHCYTVMKKVTAGNTGRVREQLIGYYSQLEACLDSIAEDAIKTQSYESIQDFVDTHKDKITELKTLKLQ
jgi:hypothetical protein